VAGSPGDIIRIGNSNGIRIPKTLLQQTKLEGKIELDVVGGQILIRPEGEPPVISDSAPLGIKTVTIGGGTGGFMLLSALRHYVGSITAIVNMSDDGGSTGILRDEFGILPPGDIRQCLVALSTTPEYMRELFNYRFDEGSLKGHAFGNLLLTALEKIAGSFSGGVQLAEQILQVRGRVLPVTTSDVRVEAVFPDGTKVSGEHMLQQHDFSGNQPKLTLSPAAHITKEASSAIKEADLVIIGPGDLHSSIIPSLLPTGMSEALRSTRAKKIYVSNLVNKPNTTKGMQVSDYVTQISDHLGFQPFDYVLYNIEEPSRQLIGKYMREGEEPIQYDESVFAQATYAAIGFELLSKGVAQPVADTLISRNLIRHDGDKLARAIMKTYFS